MQLLGLLLKQLRAGQHDLVPGLVETSARVSAFLLYTALKLGFNIR